MKNSLVGYVLGGLALLVLDIITLLLLLNIWALINLPLFPWALVHIIFVLLILHIVLLTSGLSVKQFGVPFTAVIAALSLFYYLFAMVFTGLTYPFIAVKGYVLISLLAFLFYILCCFGLYFSGMTHRLNTLRREAEQIARLDWQMALLQIGQAIAGLRQSLPDEQYRDLDQAYQLMQERISASSPIGSSGRPEIAGLEQQVRARLGELSGQIGRPNPALNPEQAVPGWIAACTEIRQMVMNREQLLVR
jgi:hypothetical protein